MKKGVFSFLIVMLVGCAVTTVEHRYKQRFDHFYRLLNKEEKAAFCSDDFATFGKLLENRMASDQELSNAMDKVMFDEAIHTFRMDQVGLFFKKFILTGFHQDDYAFFVSALPSQVLVKFAYDEKAVARDIQALIQKDKRLSSWWKKVTTDGRLGDFSLEQVLSFYRRYIFPVKTHAEVYFVAKFLSDNKLLKAFLEGSPDFENRLKEIKKQIVISREIKAIKERAQISSLSDEEFFRLYREVILREMDKGALAKTLAMFPLE
ncbi:hypothetical protein BREVNS_0290 [Brevinematales bacterium NS]|nr:hypothetical protein [Brevinematales bacterium]QJR21040.1 hypothetical protein BREVNS_0290 [Brevinematales bacterium NS]